MTLSDRDLEVLDPLRLDREIRRAAESFVRDARRLGTGDVGDADPFFATRLVTSRRAFTAVSELPEADPLREPLRRWIYRLAEYRIDRGAFAHECEERYVREHVVSEPERVRIPLAAVLARALGEPARQSAWAASFLGAATPLGESAALLWERRREVAARMGISHPDVIETPGEDARDAAARFLDDTSDMYAEHVPASLAGVLDAALGRKAPEGFPRHLVPRTILDFFRDTDLFRSVDVDPGPLPELLAPASFVRALLRVFAAWSTAAAPGDQPFVVAHDPYGLERFTVGALFAGLPMTAPFARRALGLDASKIVDHGRTMATSALIASRLAALRVLLRPHALEGGRALREAFESGCLRTLGFPVPRGAALAFVRLRVDDVQRFAGLLLGAGRAARFVGLHEEDWYRNPRAIEELRDESRLSPATTTTREALDAGLGALTRALAARLG